MIQLMLALLMTTCTAKADPGSLAWWLLPSNSESLPTEIEEDDNGVWTELWGRPQGSTHSSSANSIMEQGLGYRWVGLNPGKDGKPSHTILVVAGRDVVDILGDVVKLGLLDDETVTWGDKTSSRLVEYKKRGRRRRKSAVINFGKVNLPDLTPKNLELTSWSLESITPFLNHMPVATDAPFLTRDLSTVAQLSDPDGSLLNFRYSPKCSFEDRRKIENTLALDVEPKLTCWTQQNPELGDKLISVLQQRPFIECKPFLPARPAACAMASLPLADTFFASTPQITLAMKNCDDELGNTLLHEIFHLVGVKETDSSFTNYFQQSEACRSLPAELDFDDNQEEFYNDFQVETRFQLLRKVRDESPRWNWSEGERAFVLGSISSKMGDKYARKFFQTATESNLPGMITLPEGTQVSWAALAAFKFYDSIGEDIERMHELVRYLRRDPKGILLKRMETGDHRLHDFYLVLDALKAVKSNRGICNGEMSEHILCEDLVQLVKTPWFKQP